MKKLLALLMIVFLSCNNGDEEDDDLSIQCFNENSATTDVMNTISTQLADSLTVAGRNASRHFVITPDEHIPECLEGLSTIDVVYKDNLSPWVKGALTTNGWDSTKELLIPKQ